MQADMNWPADVNEYIAGFPIEVQELLQQMRATIRSAAPDAEEAIKYRMPTFVLGENLVHFAGYKHHIGFYPTSSGIAAFVDELSPYKHAKGSVQFPLNKPIPLDLVEKIVKFRVDEIVAKVAQKRSKKGS